jgi:hypothetical protein
MAVYPGGSPWSSQTELATEMAANDIIGLINFSAGEFRKQKYSVFQSFFLKTNEDRNVSANIEFQDTYKAKFGNDGDFTIFHTNPDHFLKSEKVAAKLKIQLEKTGPSTLTMMEFDPEIGTNGVIALGATIINKTGANNAGLQFLSNDVAKFFDKVELFDNLDMASNYISGNGTDVGLSFSGGANAAFSGTVTATGKIRTNNVFNVNGSDGISQIFASFPGSMTFTGGILTAWTP